MINIWTIISQTQGNLLAENEIKEKKRFVSFPNIIKYFPLCHDTQISLIEEHHKLMV
jgi:hypothetical protein